MSLFGFLSLVIGLPVLLVGVVFGCIFGPEKIKEWRKRRSPAGRLRAAAFQVLETSILDQPERWKPESRFYITNEAAKARVWVANRDYGLHVEIDGERIDPDERWKKRLWSAVCRRHLGAEERLLVQMVDGIRDTLTHTPNRQAQFRERII